MFPSRDARFVIFVSAVGILLMLSASFAANKRIRDWRVEFATSTEAPTYMSSSLFLEHHRLLDAVASYARSEPHVSREDLLDRVEIYWSRYNLLNSNGDIFEAAEITRSMSWLPPDSHSEILAISLSQIRAKLEPVLLSVERQINVLEPGDLQGYMKIRLALDAFSDPLAKLQIASFERKLYLDKVQVALSEQLRSSLRNSFVGIGAGVVLLSYVFMLYLRQKRMATKKLKDINRQLLNKIQESERLGKELSFRARHDSLSGVMNRFGFSEELDNLLAKAEGAHGLCFVDLDLFKVVNDTCGHAAGDDVIRDIARLLCEALPENAVVARFGGDEFVILMRDCEQSTFVEIINNCCSDLKNYIFTYSGQRFDVTGSFGAAHFEAGEFDGQALLGIVDAACYEAKNAGGARVHFHHGDDDIVETRKHDLYWVANIQNAIEAKNFRLLRQPIMALNETLSGRPDHWEVLVRMIGKHGELIPPGQFLDVAERYALSPRIDKWVIENTYAWLNACHAVEDRAEFVNINLSGVSIGDADFLDYIEKQTISLEIPTNNICFEITETAAMRKHARTFLLRLKELGYQLALDDFGIGFSSFGYLESLPVDFIKIDGLFVRDLEHNRTHREFVKSINDIGKVMGKQTIAEYVESPGTVAVLKDMGVDFAQGYFLASPSPLTMPATTKRDGRMSA